MIAMMESQTDFDAYNRIQHIDDFKSTVHDTQLQGLAAILVNHNAHHNFSIRLLHRHRFVDPDHAMVSKWTKPDELECTMQSVHDGPIFPCAFFSENNNLLPYEFSDTKAPLPDERLSRDVADYLTSENLDHLLAVEAALPDVHPWMEHELPGLAGTATRPLM